MNSSDWNSIDFDFPDRIPTMISTSEMQYLYWLGSAAWQGNGLVVEIGPWLGGSTWCLAAGMSKSGHRTGKRLVVYDNYIWRDFMSDRAPLDLVHGECFEAQFLQNVCKYESIVDSYKRALPDEIISSDKDAQSKRYVAEEDVPLFQGAPGAEPVEILFVDGAKSWMGLKHLLVNVCSRLIQDRSLIVCQDFKYWGNYWVPLLMTFLEDYLVPVHNVVSATTVTFRLIQPIPREVLEVLPNHITDVSTKDALAAIDGACEVLRTNGDVLGSANVGLGKVMLLSHQDQLEAAVAAFRDSQFNWPCITETAQLERARKYLADSRSTYISPPPVMRAFQTVVRALQAARRTAGRILKPRIRG